ncbi:MAG TPA: ATP-binding protein [Fimbriiglobus sp.]
MTLTARFSLFFLAALAVALAGFTAAFYFLARSHLHRQQDERLDAALATLTAAVEIRPTVVEWEPAERNLILGLDPADDEPRWVIRDADGKIVARSGNLSASGSDVEAGLSAAEPAGANRPTFHKFRGPDEDRWRVKVVRLQPTGLPPASTLAPEAADAVTKFLQLNLSVGLSTRPTEETLRTLLVGSSSLSLVLWVFAAVGGRGLGRWALAPLTRMASAARAMPATDLARRLPAAGTKDELDDLAAAFNGLLGRVEEAFSRQERFTSEASHQLRTPLTAILGQADVALRRDRPEAEYRDALERIRRQGNNLVRVVDALLFLARADADAALPGNLPFDVAAWVAERIAQGQQATHVQFSPPAEPILAFGQPELLGQVFDNFLDNAFKYSPPGSPVAVRVSATETHAVLDVEDRGPGIPREDLVHLFEPFFRSTDARRRGVSGLGLGLAVAKRIADAVGATVSVTSVVGKGSTFSIRIPRLE